MKSAGYKINPSLIDTYFINAWGLEPDVLLDGETVAPAVLLNANRMDIVCKLYYIECREKGEDLSYAKELYKAHIEAFSGGTFIEPGLSTKSTITDYFESFDRLIDDIHYNGFDPEKSILPVGEDGSLLDGSHRAAICIYYKITPIIVRIPGQKRKYDYKYFKANGMKEEYLDFMAYQFIRFSERVYSVCLWPAAYDEKKLSMAEQIIAQSAELAYSKDVNLNYHGIKMLMISFYKEMGWIGSIDNGFSGVSSKIRECYKSKAPTRLYVISGINLEKVVELKQRIRDFYAIGNSSVHITDTHEEAVEAGKLLLFKNSIDFLNFGDPLRNRAYFKDFVQRLQDERLCKGPINTLVLYGIVEREKCDDNGQSLELVSPNDYFYFWGERLPSLNCVKESKNKANGGVSEEDIRRIEAFNKENAGDYYAADSKNRKSNNLWEKVSTLSTGLINESKRRIRVFYHRIKYRKALDGSGEKNVENLQAVFLNINTTTADYLIMRNWEGFYDDILLEGHNDIDVLCRDRDTRDIIVRLLDAKPITNDGFHFCFKYKGREVTLDTRIVGDGYYDRRWQRQMLKDKKLHPLGFYIMDPRNYYYSLAYHAIYQKKNGLSGEYKARLGRMSPYGDEVCQEELAARLNEFMNDKRYAYTMTMDKSVVKAFDNSELKKRSCYPLNIRFVHLAESVRDRHPFQRLKIEIRKLIKRG